MKEEEAVLCSGYRCLDRDECFAYDRTILSTTIMHTYEECPQFQEIGRLRFQYLTKCSDLLLITVDELEELMRCTWVNKLVFQRSTLLRNYAFWGFTDTQVHGFDCLDTQLCPSGQVPLSSKVAVGHVPGLEHVETNALGLFATNEILEGELIGEYAGLLTVHESSDQGFDAYGMRYPSVYEAGDLYISASEYGNAIRCINHRSTANAVFRPMLYDGLLRVFCFALENIAPHEQIFVNYGDAYWRKVGVEPVDM